MLWYFYIIQLELAWYGMELCISKKKNKVTDHDKIKYGIMCQNRSFITLIYINYYHNLNKHLVCVSCSSHNKFDCNVLSKEYFGFAAKEERDGCICIWRG